MLISNLVQHTLCFWNWQNDFNTKGCGCRWKLRLQWQAEDHCFRYCSSSQEALFYLS